MKALKTTSATLQKCKEGETALQIIKYATQDLEDNINEFQRNIEDLGRSVKNEAASVCEKKLGEGNQKLLKQHDDMKAYIGKRNGSLEFAKIIIKKDSNEQILLLEKEIKAMATDIQKECPELLRAKFEGIFPSKLDFE